MQAKSPAYGSGIAGHMTVKTPCGEAASYEDRNAQDIHVIVSKPLPFTSSHAVRMVSKALS